MKTQNLHVQIQYLTAIRETHQASGSNSQTIRVGDVVQVHDETPKCNWKLAVVTELHTGGDGMVRAAAIQSSNRRITNRPICKLYPLAGNEGETLFERENVVCYGTICKTVPFVKWCTIYHKIGTKY